MAYGKDDRFGEQVGLLIGAMGSDHSATVHAAEAELSMIGSTVVSYLLSALSNAKNEIADSAKRKEGVEEQVRIVEGITRTLGIIGDPTTVPVLAKELPKLEALEALSKVGDQQALKEVISCLPRLSIWRWDYSSNRVDKSGDYSQDEINYLVKIIGRFGDSGKKALEAAADQDSPAQSWDSGRSKTG
ncbi:MAG TPA: hypothetical protein VFF30_07145 [Nitrososphaerales archaeon]|nr:hypothetical protein [Nitrososphaerales archaeon]